ncbi:MAG: NADH:flavin oxidoreductase, partial [Candidatus Heimdallarchaeota archaeon]|nr:NADH:flavin oxidoreductase [Candidatus Heimdallarchaeota archaeon]
MKFFKLFEPFIIGTVEIQNRVIMPAMHLSAADDGYCSDQIIAFYRRRAQGKVGLIIIGGIGTSPVGQGLPTMLSLYDPKFIPKLRQLTDAIHKEGSKVCAQLYHAGAYSLSADFGGEQAVSSSAIYSKFSHKVPRALSTEEVGGVIDEIVTAAQNAHEAGFDGVEILSSAGYLIDQFLSPLKNTRTDRYGGETIQERLTFPLELIKKLKETVGNKLFIGARFSGDDFVSG